jgi:hypothetical protein
MLLLFFSAIVSAQMLNIPSANTNIEAKVETEIIDQIALTHSRILWCKVSRGFAIPLSDFEGNILAYEISFSIKHTKFPSYEDIIQSVRKGRKLIEESYIWGNKELLNKGRKLKWGVDCYRTMIISARNNMYPIIEYSTGLSRFYTTGDLAREKAVIALGTTDVKLTRIYFAGHLDKWFEFTSNDGRKILIDVYSLEANLPEKILTKQPENIQEVEEIEFIKLNNIKTWQKIKSGIAIINDARAKSRIVGVPFYDWSFGCSPTSSAMVLGYWEMKGYDKLIDYYFDRWDPGQKEWDYDVPNVQEELAKAMKTNLENGWTRLEDMAPGNMYVTNDINGYRFKSYASAISNLSNNFNWGLIKEEIDAGRPFHWLVNDYYSYEWGFRLDHSVAAVGYTTDYFVIVHNTWDTQEHYWYYYTDIGGLISVSWVIPIIPNKKIILKP